MKEQKKKSNKKFLAFSLMTFFAIAVVAAGGYMVHSLVIKSDVYEPFSVQYAVIGDGGNWDGVTTCDTYAGDWATYENGFELDVQGLYAGEARVVCAKVSNAGEGDVAYTLSSEVLNTNEEVRAKCLDAFGEEQVTGTALALSDTVDGAVVQVAGNAAPVEDCRIQVSVLRG